MLGQKMFLPPKKYYFHSPHLLQFHQLLTFSCFSKPNPLPKMCQPKKLTNFKWQISKGDVKIVTFILPQTFEKASFKNVHLVPENQEP